MTLEFNGAPLPFFLRVSEIEMLLFVPIYLRRRKKGGNYNFHSARAGS
jgi:hypothetical protein